MEQFIVLAFGIVIFSMIVLTFQSAGDSIEEKNQVRDLSEASNYLAVNIIDTWQTANTGKSATVERTLSLPMDGTALFRDGKVCITTSAAEECSPLPINAKLKGKAYTLEKFTLISTREGVELKNAQ